MRLKEVYSICNEYMEKIPKMDIKKEFKANNKTKNITEGETCYVVSEEKIEDILKELENLSKVSVLWLTIENIKKMVILDNRIRTFYTEKMKGNLLKNFKDLFIQLETIIDLCETYGYTSQEYVGFDIKLPINKDLTSMVKVLNNFDKIINQAPFLNGQEATIEYKKVDLGSTWMEFVINGIAATALLRAFSNFVDDCIKIISHKKSCKQQEEDYRRMQIDNEIVEGMVKAHNKMTDALIDNFIKELCGEVEPEEQARARLCFDMMIELFDKGVEIHQAITKNESEKLLFPTSQQWKEISDNSIVQENIEQVNKETEHKE